MTITPEDLPQLIAAAVKKAVDEGQITQESLNAMLHRPITIGLLPAPEAQADIAEKAAILPNFPIRLGYHFNGLQQLTSLDDVKGPSAD